MIRKLFYRRARNEGAAWLKHVLLSYRVTTIGDLPQSAMLEALAGDV